MLLPEAKKSTRNSDRQDDESVSDIASEHCNAGGDQQDEHNRARELFD
jgi:hypothetical protein